MIKNRQKIYEGKAKILFEGPEPGTLVQYFKDDATAFNNQKHSVLDGKGVLNNRISEFMMLRLEDIGIKTHFIKRLNTREQLIKKVKIFPLEVVVRNVAAGSICKRLGIEKGKKFDQPLVEFFYKNDSLGDPLVSGEHILAFNWAESQELDAIIAITMRINDFMQGLFAAIGFKLVDFKLEFGALDGEDDTSEYRDIILADEISPDNCRLWDIKSGESFDKDKFRNDEGDLVAAYTEVARRLGLIPQNGEVAEVIHLRDVSNDKSDK